MGYTMCTVQDMSGVVLLQASGLSQWQLNFNVVSIRTAICRSNLFEISEDRKCFEKTKSSRSRC
jgi:hypothetical protein